MDQSELILILLLASSIGNKTLLAEILVCANCHQHSSCLDFLIQLGFETRFRPADRVAVDVDLYQKCGLQLPRSCQFQLPRSSHPASVARQPANARLRPWPSGASCWYKRATETSRAKWFCCLGFSLVCVRKLPQLLAR